MTTGTATTRILLSSQSSATPATTPIAMSRQL